MSLAKANRDLGTVVREAALTRRRFLTVSVSGAAAAAVASLLSACAPTASPPPAAGTGGAVQPAAGATSAAVKPAAATTPAAQAAPGGFTGGGSIKMLTRSHFVPAFDKWLDKWAADWGAKNKVDMQIDHILAGELPAKIAAEVAAGSGHDLYGFSRPADVPLYNKQLLDVSDIAKQLGDQHGGWVELGQNIGQFEGTWKGVPEFFIDFPGLYRKDLFDQFGLKPVDTWDDLLKSGTILKDKGYRIGIAINQKSNDSLNSWSAVLWSFGASTVAQDGKTVAINSPQTKEALAFAIELYQKTMTNEVLSWDDSGNNLLLSSGKGSWIHNPISALRTIEKEDPNLAKNIAISNSPGGPKGRNMPVSSQGFGVAKWTTNASAVKAFLTDYYQALPEGIKASEGYNQPLLKSFRKKPMPVLGEDPRLNILQDFDQYARSAGYPGTPTQAAGEVEANWIVPLMVGRAVQDGNINSAVEWATQKIEAIYAKY
jgi:multiple sugar transport system substrate-binding protein